MKKALYVCSTILLFTVLTVGFIFPVSAETGNGWNFESNTGTLEITSDAAFADDTVPWAGYRNQILSVEIKEGVTLIGDSAFSECSQLSKVSFAENGSLQSIGGEAFYKCGSLTEIRLPNGVTAIGGWAFNQCTSLQTVVLPKSVRSIGSAPFGNTALSTLAYCGTRTEWNEIEKAASWNSGIGSDVVSCHADHWTTVDANTHETDCSYCTYVDTKTHRWDAGKISTAPTHTSEGVKTYTCIDCGNTKTEKVAKDPTHVHGGWISYDNKQHKKECACGEGTIYADHNWNDGEILVESTHLVAGQKKFVCADCGKTKIESCAKDPVHIYGEWTSYDDEDQHKKTCVCGAAVIYGNHTWDQGVTDREATHLEEGKKTYTCVDCGEKKQVVLAKDPVHIYGEWMKHDGDWHKKVCDCEEGTVFEAHEWDGSKITVEPTHTKDGERTYVCTVCGEKRVEIIAKTTEHIYQDYFPCDENENWHKQVCECGEGVVFSAHHWDDGTVVLKPTHTKMGQTVYTCTDCGVKKTVDTAKTTEHSYEDWMPHDESWHKQACECGEETVYELHQWDAGKVTKHHTATEAGEFTYTCVECEATRTVALEVAHIYGEWEQHDDNQHKMECACGEDAVYADHVWDEGTVAIAATHLKAGEMVYICADCGEIKRVPIPQIAEHTYGEWTSDGGLQHKKECECGKVIFADHAWNNGETGKVPTHLEDGEKTYTCADCGETKIEVISKNPAHVYLGWVSCSDDENRHEKKCECGEGTLYANHVWDDGRISVSPTHMQEGKIVYTCVDCGATKTEILDRDTAHVFGKWIICAENEALHMRACECGMETVYAEHTWDNGEVIKKPTHTDTGTKLYTCTECGHTKKETLAKTPEHDAYGKWIDCGEEDCLRHKRICECETDTVYAEHVWDQGVVTKDYTHMTKGEIRYTCEECKAVKTVVTAAGHHYGDWIGHDESQHKKICECGEEPIYADHVWNEGETVVAPTHTAEGVKRYTCTDCGAIKDEALAKNSQHIYGEWIADGDGQHKRTCICGNIVVDSHSWDAGNVTVEPTLDSEGEKIYTCSDCGHTRKESVPMIGLFGCSSTVLTGAGAVLLLVVSAAALMSRKKKKV